LEDTGAPVEGASQNNAIKINKYIKPCLVSDLLTDLIMTRNETRKIKEDENLQNYIAEELINGCIRPNFVSFKYLRDAILVYVKDKNGEIALKSKAYKIVSEMNNSNIIAVERGIRTIISRDWDKTTHDFRIKYFGAFGVLGNRKPTPKEFVMSIADQIKRDLKDR